MEPRRCGARSSRTGEPCRAWAVVGATVCVAHGGAAPQVRRAAARRLASEQVARKLAEVEVTPIGDPLEELERLAGEAIALKNFLASRVAAIEQAESSHADTLRKHVRALHTKAVQLLLRAEEASDLPTAMTGISQALGALRELGGRPVGGQYLQAELDLYLSALDRSERFLRDLAALGLDERRVRLAERQGELVADVLMGAMTAVFALVREALESGALDRDRLLAIEREEWPAIASRELRALVPDREGER